MDIMTHTELQKLTSGRFTKVANTENSIVIGTIGSLTKENITYEVILYFANYFGISTDPDRFKYNLITADSAVGKGCKLPSGNYNEFIEIFTF